MISVFSFQCCDYISVTVGQLDLEMTSKSVTEELHMRKVRPGPNSVTQTNPPTLIQALIHKIPVALKFPQGVCLNQHHYAFNYVMLSPI